MKNYNLYKTNANRSSVLMLALFTLSLASCDNDEKQNVAQKNWEMVWNDEFEGAAQTLPDASKWGYDLGNNNGWGNQELQNYTNKPENVSLDGEGNLVLTALNNGGSFTSARIKTKELFSQTYGRFEARLKTPYGPGIWPAFWMLGADIDSNPWPQCGEIDIMELRGQMPNIIAGTLHGPGYSGGNAITASHALYQSRYDVDYHVFAVEWNADKIDFFMDNYLYQSLSKADISKKGEWVYDSNFFMILNVAVGGNYAGFPTSQTPFPQKMIIDYVRVYKEIK